MRLCVVFATAGLVTACSDEEQAVAPATLYHTLQAGTYDTEMSRWVCGQPDTVLSPLSVLVCETEMLDENNTTFDCPVEVTDDGLSMKCTIDRDKLAPGCVVTATWNLSGEASGDTLTLGGTVAYSNQEGCEGLPTCYGFLLIMWRTGDPTVPCPTAPFRPGTTVHDILSGVISDAHPTR